MDLVWQITLRQAHRSRESNTFHRELTARNVPSDRPLLFSETMNQGWKPLPYQKLQLTPRTTR